MKKIVYLITLFALVFTSCTTIKQDEIGIKRTFGRISSNSINPGLVLYNPIFTRVIKTPIRTVNLAINANLPSKEGLNVQSEISILYRIKTNEFSNILSKTGLDFQEILILPVFRSAASDICSKYEAKDMHSAKRSEIEHEIKERMMNVVESKGFIIEAVLMKSITLPSGLAKAIEEKLQAEQDAQRMEFLKERERKDAERKIIQTEGEKQSRIIAAQAQKSVFEIEAEGRANALKTEAAAQAKANEMLNNSLTPQLIKLKQIDAFRELSKSSNTKTIITDGKTPFLSLPNQ
ncbi:MAG: SPFH domain-containing protein [Bacteroidia bacterium]